MLGKHKFKICQENLESLTFSIQKKKGLEFCNILVVNTRQTAVAVGKKKAILLCI